MIGAAVTGDTALEQKFAALPEGARSKIILALGPALDGLRSTAAANINSRSGQLADSLTAGLVRDNSTVKATLASDLPYAAAQEYGYQGAVSVREYVQVRTVAFGRPIAAVPVTIRAHAMQMNIPAQSYLRNALSSNTGSILGQLNDAVAAVVQGA